MTHSTTPSVIAGAITLALLAADAAAFEPGTLKWAFETGNDVVASPTVAADGTVYIGSTDGHLYAINPNGTQKWVFATGFDVWGTVTLGPDGTLYFGSGDGYIYALNPNGTQRWAFAMGAGTFSSPAIGADGTVYVGSLDHSLYAINPNGTKRWSFRTGGTISSSPAIGTDGTIYCGSADNRFYAINPDGSLKWTYDKSVYGSSGWLDSPTLGADGTIYVGGDDQRLYAFNPDGSIQWTFPARGSVWGSAAIGPEGTLYFGSAGNVFYAVNPDGTRKWSIETGNWVNSSPIVGPDGTVYVGSGDQQLYAIAPDGMVKWAFSTGDPVFSSPALGPDGTVYVGTWSGWDNHVYAVHGGQPSAGVVWVSGAGATPFELEQVGNLVSGEGYVPDLTGAPMRVSLAGTLVGDRFTAPLMVYVGTETTGDIEVPVIVGTQEVGTASLTVSSSNRATLTYRLGPFDLGGMGDTDLVEWVYRQLFGREADQGGRDYYLERLRTGESTRASLVSDVLAGALGADLDASSDVVLEDEIVLVRGL